MERAPSTETYVLTKTTIRNGATALAGALLLAACGNSLDTTTASAGLEGFVIDTNGARVAGAEVALAIGNVPVTPSVLTDDVGGYTLLDVPVDRVRTALEAGEEITLTIHTPREDRAPFGTFEGDRVHLTPISLRQFAKLENLNADELLTVRSAVVPLQSAGHAITEELIRDGGRLTWKFEDSPVGDLEVTLIVAPGSIHLEADDPQMEITLTPIDPEWAPMQIPDGGYGPLWTIQPRGVTFDPPAQVEFSGARMPLLGTTPPDVGSTFELFGASLEQGWQLFGDVELTAFDGMNVTLKSVGGIIHQGAWGHVFANATTDAGVLITCKDYNENPVKCAVFDDNYSSELRNGWVAWEQRDYNNQHHPIYFTDIEPVCSGCTNIGAPYAQMAMGLNICNKAADQQDCLDNPGAYASMVGLRAIRLCESTFGTSTNLATRIDHALSVSDLYDCAFNWNSSVCSNAGTIIYETADVGFAAQPRNFSYGALFYFPPCPE